MKSLLLFTFLFLLLAPALGQRNIYWVTRKMYYREILTQSPREMNHIHNFEKYHIKSITNTTHYKGSSHTTESQYNETGKITKTIVSYSKGQNIREYIYNENDQLIKEIYTSEKGVTTGEFTFNEQGLISSSSYTNAKGKKSNTTWKYNDKGQYMEVTAIDMQGKYKRSVYAYDDDGKLLEHQLFTKNTDNPTYVLSYTYYENGDKKSIRYQEKGKEKYVWNYECKPEGELVGSEKKDQSTICIQEEYDENGNRVIWNRELNDKGILVKTQTILDKDSIVISRRMYNNSDVLTSEYIRYENGSGVTKTFDKKGNVVTTRTSDYNDEGMLTKMEYHYKKYHQLHLYSYEGELLSTNVRITKNKTFVDIYEYEFYGE
ncbi:MAG: hypothetical protein R2780_13830 [Crocinitomicaceae bacterium]